MVLGQVNLSLALLRNPSCGKYRSGKRNTFRAFRAFPHLFHFCHVIHRMIPISN